MIKVLQKFRHKNIRLQTKGKIIIQGIIKNVDSFMNVYIGNAKIEFKNNVK